MRYLARNNFTDQLPPAGRAFFFLALLLAVFLAMGRFWPIGPDYFYTFRPLTEAFFRGETRLFDASSPGYFNAPWAVFLIAPTLLLPLSYGQAAITLISMIGLLLAIHVVVPASARTNLRVFLAAVVLATANLHTFDLVIRGNVDGFLLLGLGLGWLGIKRRQPWLLGAGFWLLSIKPVNVALPALVMLWAARNWSRQEKLACLALLGLTLLLSFPLFGLDWPLRYLQFMTYNQPFIYLQTSLWRTFAFFGLPPILAMWTALPVLALFGVMAWRYARVDRLEELLALAIVTNLFISPYTLGSHYVLLAPVFVLLAVNNPWLFSLWLLTLTPLLRTVWGFDVTWIDIVYPLALMIALFLRLPETKKPRPG